jgi:predicted dienelactone hydrolase
MPFVARRIIQLALVLCISIMFAAAALAAGPYAVGTSCIQIDTGKIASGRSLNDYLQGNWDGDQRFYVDQILASPESTFFYQMPVPDDRSLYGDLAGKVMPMVAVIFYPTDSGNRRPDYEFPEAAASFPRMQRPGEGPIFPAGDQRFPVLLGSHGYGGHPASDAELINTMALLASNGYIVVALFHGDLRVPETLGGAPFPYVQLTLRPLELKVALDHLGAQPQFADRADWDRIGGIGGSFGGAAMMLLTGARILDLNSFGTNLTTYDPRVKAAAGIVSYCGDDIVPLFGFDTSGAENIKTPQIIIGGSEDEVAPTWRQRDALRHAPVRSYLVTLHGQEHLFSPEGFQDAAVWALDFLDAFVKGDEDARIRLDSRTEVPGGPRDTVEHFN